MGSQFLIGFGLVPSQVVAGLSYPPWLGSISLQNGKCFGFCCTQGHFKVLKRKNPGAVGNLKSSCKNRDDFGRGKLEYGQLRAVASCQRDVPTSGIDQAKKR
ncbi:hypothetical protein Gotur_011188 [Gossypium turneri]